jgi:phosphate transport system substrate-binding protein
MNSSIRANGLSWKLLAIAMMLLSISGCLPSNSVGPRSDTSTSPSANPQSTQHQSSPQTSIQGATQASQTIKLLGSGSTYTLLQLLADSYQYNSEHAQLVFAPAVESGNAITSVRNHLIDLGGVTRQLEPNEEDGKIQYQEIAHDLLIVATHPSVNGVTNLSTQDLQAIYSGKARNWRQFGGPDAEIVVLDRPEDESAKKLLRKYYLGKDLKNSPRTIILKQEGELIRTLQSTPYAIGAFSLGYAIAKKLPMNRLSLDGVSPTSENLINGKYRMIRRIGLVFGKSPSKATQGFVDFINSPEGVAVMQKNGFTPAGVGIAKQ